MTLTGLEPDNARALATTMRADGVAADDLSGTVTAALTLSQLDSTVPGRLIAVGGELDQVGIIIAARVDIAEGFVLDPATLAQDLGLDVGRVTDALGRFDDAETDLESQAPLIDLLIANKEAAAALQSAFVTLPPPGTDPLLDALFARLASWFPGALAAGKLPVDLPDADVADLVELADQVGVADRVGVPDKLAPGLAGFDLFADRAPVLKGGLDLLGALTPGALFDQVAEIYELDRRLASAAGLPTTLDIYDAFDFTVGDPWDRTELWAELDSWLPALLAGQVDAGDVVPADDPRAWYLATLLAVRLGFDPGPDWVPGQGLRGQPETVQRETLDAALAFLTNGRFLQKALIPGDFEGVEGPLLIWSEGGVESALLAGRQAGVIDDTTAAIADQVAEAVLGDGDGTDAPIELSEEQQQALIAAIAAQNGEAFVADNPNIQRQLVSALNLVGQQGSLADQKRVFASVIEAFRSLAVVGSPAMTWRQLQAAVGPEVIDELGYSKTVNRSAKGINKHPQFITLVQHWGIPGSDKLKLKKYKFSFTFDEQGRLSAIRNKKLSKRKRLKNTVKAIGKSIWKTWKDNPWKYLFLGPFGLFPGANQLAEGVEDGDFGDIFDGTLEMTKTAATLAALVAPGTNAAAVAALTSAAIGLIEGIQDNDFMTILSSSFSVVGGAAGFLDSAAKVGSLANLVQTGADFGGKAIRAVDAAEELIDAIEDGGTADILTSGLGMLGATAGAVSSGAEFGNSVGAALGDSLLASADQLAGLAQAGVFDLRSLQDVTTHQVFSADTIRTIEGLGTAARRAGSVVDIGTAAIAGDGLGVADGLIDVVGGALDPGSAQATQLDLLGRGIDVARVVEAVYQTGAVPDYDRLFNTFAAFGVAAGSVRFNDPPPPPPPPPVLPRGPAQSGTVRLAAFGPGGGEGSRITQQELITIPEDSSLSELAALHGITTDELLAANPQITDPGAGDTLALPEGVKAHYSWPDGERPVQETNEVTAEELFLGAVQLGELALIDWVEGLEGGVNLLGDLALASIDVTAEHLGLPRTAEAQAGRQRIAALRDALNDAADRGVEYVIDSATGEATPIDDLLTSVNQVVTSVTDDFSEAQAHFDAGDGTAAVLAGGAPLIALLGHLNPAGLIKKVAKRPIVPYKKRANPQHIRDMVQARVIIDEDGNRLDPATGFRLSTERAQADHIVPEEWIVNPHGDPNKLKGFLELDSEDQRKVLENPKNFIGMDPSSNASRGNQSFEEWYRGRGRHVLPEFREAMIIRERILRSELQQQIDDLLRAKGKQPAR
jgi:hypothetical protein